MSLSALPCSFNRSSTLFHKVNSSTSPIIAFSLSPNQLPRTTYYDNVSLQNSILRFLELSKTPRELKQIHALVTKNPSLQTQYIYNAIIQGLSSFNPSDTVHSLEAIVTYREMLSKGLLPNNYTLPFVLKSCAQARALREGQEIHAHAVKTGLLVSNVYVNNTLMRVYVVCGVMADVRKVFDGSPQWDLVSWTTLIQGYVKMGFPREGIGVFFDMCEAGYGADEMTLTVVLSACAKLGDLSLGRKMYAYIHEKGIQKDVFVGNALVDMFLKCGNADFAYRVFCEMPVRNVVSWNSMILGLAQQGKFREALDVFKEMQGVRVEPDSVTLVGILNSCANLGMLESGKWVHAYIDKHRIPADGYIGNALIDMYAKCGSISQALGVFKGMKDRDVYSYTAIIVGLAMHGEAAQALRIFSDMCTAGIKPDEVTFLGVLSACSHSGLVEEGRQHFKHMQRIYNLEPQMEHYGCMVDLFGRAGLFTEAKEFIKNMPVEPDAFVWGALLGACRIYGKVELGQQVMQKLMEIEPEREGAYILMSNMYSSAYRWWDALKLRKSMKEKDVKKTPGCSSIQLDGIVHEFRKGDRSHPKSKEIYEFIQEFMIHLKSYGELEIL